MTGRRRIDDRECARERTLPERGSPRKGWTEEGVVLGRAQDAVVGFVLFALQLRRMVAERRSVWEVDNALVCMPMDNSRDRGAAALQRPGDLSDRVTRRELLSGLDHELAWQALSSAQRSRTWATWWASRSGGTAPATWSCRARQDGVRCV